MSKKSLKDRLIFFAATRFGWLLILLLGRLMRITILGSEHIQRLRENGIPFLLCVWHGRMLLPIYLHRKDRMHVIVSEHRDGEMIARTLQKLGYIPVRGSSTRGGSKAALGLIRALRCGQFCAIIPDGPKGPRHEFKGGALAIARKTGAPLLPLTFAASRAVHFNSWDRFIMWKPFSRCVAIYGAPYTVPDTPVPESFEAARQEIQRRMIELDEQADAYFRK